MTGPGASSPEVRLERLRAGQIDAAMARAPIAWLPLGALEYHAAHVRRLQTAELRLPVPVTAPLIAARWPVGSDGDPGDARSGPARGVPRAR